MNNLYKKIKQQLFFFRYVVDLKQNKLLINTVNSSKFTFKLIVCIQHKTFSILFVNIRENSIFSFKRAENNLMCVISCIKCTNSYIEMSSKGTGTRNNMAYALWQPDGALADGYYSERKKTESKLKTEIQKQNQKQKQARYCDAVFFSIFPGLSYGISTYYFLPRIISFDVI